MEAQDIKFGILSIQMVFKVTELGEITKKD